MTKWVYTFTEGSRDMRELLGGKGAGVAEMTRLLGPERVPPGFTITTEACVAYMRADGTFPEACSPRSTRRWADSSSSAGKRLGDPEDPLLVSVRSGARESMPGMMDSVLNLGLNDESVAGLAARTHDERFAWDCYRRLRADVRERRARRAGRAIRGRDRAAPSASAASSSTSSSTHRRCES